MRHYLSLWCFALSTVFCINNAWAVLSTTEDISLEAVAVGNSEGYQISKVQWLPDFLALGKNSSRVSTPSSGSGSSGSGGSSSKLTCATYGRITCLSPNVIKSGAAPLKVGDDVCYKPEDCECPEGYSTANTESICRDTTVKHTDAIEYNGESQGKKCGKCFCSEPNYNINRDIWFTTRPTTGSTSYTSVTQRCGAVTLYACNTDKGWEKYGENCRATSCPEGYSTANTASTCRDTEVKHTDAIEYDGYSGGKQCGKCFCSEPNYNINRDIWFTTRPTTGSTSYTSVTQRCGAVTLYACNTDKGWEKYGENCRATSCPEGYSTANTASTCRDSTVKHTDMVDYDGYSGGKQCGKCFCSEPNYNINRDIWFTTKPTSAESTYDFTTLNCGVTFYKCKDGYIKRGTVCVTDTSNLAVGGIGGNYTGNLGNLGNLGNISTTPDVVLP